MGSEMCIRDSVEATLAGERARGEERVAAVRREYQKRERETVQQLQDTLERSHRLGSTINALIGQVQKSPAVSAAEEAQSTGATQSVSGLREEAARESTSVIAASVGAGRGGARPMTRARTAAGASSRASIPPLRIGVQEGRVIRVVNPERRRGHQADTASSRARARDAAGSASSRRSRRAENSHSDAS